MEGRNTEVHVYTNGCCLSNEKVERKGSKLSERSNVKVYIGGSWLYNQNPVSLPLKINLQL